MREIGEREKKRERDRWNRKKYIGYLIFLSIYQGIFPFNVNFQTGVKLFIYLLIFLSKYYTIFIKIFLISETEGVCPSFFPMIFL